MVNDVDCENEGRAGVVLPLGPLTEGCRLRLPVPGGPAAAARAAEACDCPAVGMMWGVAVLLAVPPFVEGVVTLRPDTEEDERCRRDGVGCVGPVIWWFGFGSAGSIRAVLAALECDVLLATEAECWARRAESSRVRRFTWRR